MNLEKYEQIFLDMRSNYEKEKEKTDRQKALGKHDYNIFTTFFKESNEVKLHSKFIASLLDINNDHYKNDLFLELFLNVCGLDDFGLDTKNAYVLTEYKNIDIYISDGEKHIIIENKVYTYDQNSQIQRYIDAIKDEQEDKNSENIYVIYLNLWGYLPSENSLGNYSIVEEIDDKNVILKDDIRLKVITYKNEILLWVEKCRNWVSNINDLNAILIHYQNVIKMLYNKYERVDKMSNEALKKIIDSNYEDVKELAKEYVRIREKTIEKFFDEVRQILCERLKNKNFKIESSKKPKNIYYQPIKISNEDNTKGWELFYFALEFQEPNYNKLNIGFWKKDNNTKPRDYKIPVFENERSFTKQSEWRLVYSEENHLKEDLYENIAVIKDLTPKDLADRICGILNQFDKFDLEKK